MIGAMRHDGWGGRARQGLHGGLKGRPSPDEGIRGLWTKVAGDHHCLSENLKMKMVMTGEAIFMLPITAPHPNYLLRGIHAHGVAFSCLKSDLVQDVVTDVPK